MLSPQPAGHTVPDTACCAVWVCNESTLLTPTLLGKPVTPSSFFTGQLLGQSFPSPCGCLLLLLPRAELCTPVPVHHEAAVDQLNFSGLLCILGLLRVQSFSQAKFKRFL